VPKPPIRLDLDRAVTLRQLRTFKTVADLNSFSLAAQRLKLSQPSISYQVKELEQTWACRCSTGSASAFS